MKRGSLLVLGASLFAGGMASAAEPPMRLLEVIALPETEGYFDHFGIDIKGHRLFVPGEMKRSIEVVDLQAGKVIHTMAGFGGNPRKTVYLEDSNRVFVDDGDATCKVFNAETYALIKNIELPDYARGEGVRMVPDNGRYDAESGIFFLCDRADGLDDKKVQGAIQLVDLNKLACVGTIGLPGRNPADVALDPASSRMFVTMGDTNEVVVIDRKTREILNRWPIKGGPEPHAMALDAEHHRLFIGSRVKPGHLYRPGALVVMDSESGDTVVSLDTVGGADEVAYDPGAKRVYVTGASGGVTVYGQQDADHYRFANETPTGAIAKTSLLVPELKRFYSAVPKHIVLSPPVPQSKEAAIEPARILVFSTEP